VAGPFRRAALEAPSLGSRWFAHARRVLLPALTCSAATCPSNDREAHIFVLIRAITYGTLFVGLLLVFLPAQVLSWSGLNRPRAIGMPQVAGLMIGSAGALLALWCVLTFVFVGKGTPAPFDPPRQLVVSGPYRFVRNPMYIGAGLALLGAALFFQSPALVGYLGLFWLITHLFVLLYEEPTLRRLFGEEYASYCGRVRRWLPRLKVGSGIAERGSE
jgi:protein-S-isoprenylcysteine O-methyltransferase Ste14